MFSHVIFVMNFGSVVIFGRYRRRRNTDKAEHRRQQEVDGSSHAQGRMVTNLWNQEIAGRQDTDGRTQAVRKVKHRKRNFGAALAHKTCGNKGERHADCNRNRECRARGKCDLRDFSTARRKRSGPRRIVEYSGKPNVQRVVCNTANTDGQFHQAVSQERSLGFLDHPARNKAAYGKAAHVNAEREHLAVARMPKEEFKVSRPRAFVNQAREPGQGKQEIDQEVHTSIITNEMPQTNCQLPFAPHNKKIPVFAGILLKT